MRGNRFDEFSLPVHADATIATGLMNWSGLLIALAAVMIVVFGFVAFSLVRSIGGQNGGNGSTLEALTTPTNVPYAGLVATATSYAQTPTVTTGPRTPTPTPRPPVPTQTPLPTPTATPAPGTPTPRPPTPTPRRARRLLVGAAVGVGGVSDQSAPRSAAGGRHQLLGAVERRGDCRRAVRSSFWIMQHGGWRVVCTVVRRAQPA